MDHQGLRKRRAGDVLAQRQPNLTQEEIEPTTWWPTTIGYSSTATTSPLPPRYASLLSCDERMNAEDDFGSSIAKIVSTEESIFNSRISGKRPTQAGHSTTLEHYLNDPQRHEMIALGISTINTKTSPRKNVWQTKKKIRTIIPKNPKSVTVSMMHPRSDSDISRETIRHACSHTACSGSMLEDTTMLEVCSETPYDVKAAAFGQDSGYISNTASRILPEATKTDGSIQDLQSLAQDGNSASPLAVSSSPSTTVSTENNAFKVTIGDADSDDDGSCFIPTPSAAVPAAQKNSMIRPSMTAFQMKKAEQLLVHYLLLKLNIDWQTSCLNQRGPSSNSNPGSKPGPKPRLKDAANKKGTKRFRKNNGEESSEDEKEEGFRGSEGSVTVKDFEDHSVSFACPYRKQNPRKYCVRDWTQCALRGHQTIARVKGHLYRYHLVHQCERCKELFDSDEELHAHFLGVEKCALKTLPSVDGITAQMKGQLKSRKKAVREQTSAQAWEQIFCLLFPGQEMPNPYFEPVQDRQEEMGSHESDDLIHFQEFISRDLSRLFREDVDNAFLNSGLALDETQMISLLPGTLNRAISTFRDILHRNISTPIPDEPPLGLSSLPIAPQCVRRDAPSMVSSDSGYVSQRAHTTVLYGTAENNNNPINDIPKETTTIDENITNDTAVPIIELSEPPADGGLETTELQVPLGNGQNMGSEQQILTDSEFLPMDLGGTNAESLLFDWGLWNRET